MAKLSGEDLRTLLYLVKNRLKYEARRQRTVIIDGQDQQNLKVWQLAELREKLQVMLLEE